MPWFWSQRFVCLGVVATYLLLTASTPSTQASHRYSILDLGTLGEAASYATDVDVRGRVVGYTTGARDRAFYYDGSRMVLLDAVGGTLGGARSQALGIDDGQITGWSDVAGSAGTRAFVFDGTGTRPLGTLGGDYSAGRELTYGGWVAGTAALANGDTHAFLFDGSAMRDLGTLGGRSSHANAVAGDLVTGSALTAASDDHAFLHDGSSMRDLGTLGGRTSVGNDINGMGWVVGGAHDAAGVWTAFVYDGLGMRSLGTLGGSSEALGINDFDDIVGESITANGDKHAFLYSRDSLIDLNSVIDPAAGWTLISAHAVNEAGQIVGYGKVNGQIRAYRLTPEQDLSISPYGALSSQDSNLPRGVQVGRTTTFVMSVGVQDGDRHSAQQSLTVTDTVTGPAEVVGAEVFNDQGTCAITAGTATCRVDNVGYGLTQEVHVTVRATGPGYFAHTAIVSGEAPDPNTSNNSISEDNWAISLASMTLTPTTLEGGKASSLRVDLTDTAPSGGATVQIVSSHPEVAPAKSTLYVLGGDTTRAMNVFTNPVTVRTDVTLTATYGLQSHSAILTVLPPPAPLTLPADWSRVDIGAVGVAGQSGATGDTFTLKGAGADVWGTADALHFAYKPLTADGEIVARVATIQNVNAWTKAGVMIRQSLDAGSAHAFMLVSPGKGTAFQRRKVAGGTSTSTAGALVAAPQWVKLARAGATISAYLSVDGTTWTLVGSDSIQMSGTIYAGLAVSSHITGTLATVTFDTVSVTPRTPPTTTWTNLDVGTTGAAGFYSVSGATMRVDGAGADIWGVADAFQFVYQPLTGDGDIVGRVASLENVNAWTKAGVMIRETTAANAAHASMLLSAGKGLAFQRRTAAGGLSTSTAGGAGASPMWVKLQRRGSTISAFTSVNGSTWTTVGSDTIAMGSSVLVGLAVSSHVSGVLATATFDGVTIAAPPAVPSSPDEVVLYAKNVTQKFGNWVATSDSTAADGVRLQNGNFGAEKVAIASAQPVNYFELTFNAAAGKPYRLWVRGKALSNSYVNDSVHVQFSDSVDEAGTATYRIGTTESSVVNLEDCAGCGVSGWGWQDNGYGAGVLGPAIYFKTTGTHTIRIQTREDGMGIDQVVLSAAKFIRTSPGALKNDTLIVEAMWGQ